MTKRMDHAAEARRALRAAAEDPADIEGTDPWLLAAQVHATLALVEQQRIANLIALGAAGESTPLRWTPRAEIREGLGL
ncbi:hypothetical protein [Microbacterium plantarum]|uniref:hypothetical protein n=1 Tax=Microbacterium plantarum TaxID=1816425 RepID=UPI002B48600D|nr:hypothetical protein [Microbacterium plantarum]WRK16534.1 hypothetical protein VC184_11510 [Microbacterium plantarum]